MARAFFCTLSFLREFDGFLQNQVVGRFHVPATRNRLTGFLVGTGDFRRRLAGIVVPIHIRPAGFGVCHQFFRRNTVVLNRLTVGRIVFCDRQNDRAAIVHRNRTQHGSVAICMFADNFRPFVALQRSRGHFSGRRRSAVGQHDEGQGSDIFLRIRIKVLTRRLLADRISDQAFIEEQVSQFDAVFRFARRGVAQVKQQFLSTLFLQVRHSGRDFFNLSMSIAAILM